VVLLFVSRYRWREPVPHLLRIGHAKTNHSYHYLDRPCQPEFDMFAFLTSRL
jgi:hypothetical protein